MTYSAQYTAIIERRLAMPLLDNEYGETHHIIPKSEGGTDETFNLVKLTAREHYVCHLLLAKIYNDTKMYSAVMYMQCKTMTQRRDFKFNSRLYEKMRQEFGQKQSREKKGRHWYTNGENYVMQFECPDGFVPGAPPISEEQRKKLSEAIKGRRPWNKGKQFSDETKEKMRQSHLGQPAPNRRVVQQLNLKTGEVLREFVSIKEATLQTGIGNISAVCNGHRPQAGGYSWRFKDT